MLPANHANPKTMGSREGPKRAAPQKTTNCAAAALTARAPDSPTAAVVGSAEDRKTTTRAWQVARVVEAAALAPPMATTPMQPMEDSALAVAAPEEDIATAVAVAATRAEVAVMVVAAAVTVVVAAAVIAEEAAVTAEEAAVATVRPR